jgi:hypothetical protein
VKVLEAVVLPDWVTNTGTDPLPAGATATISVVEFRFTDKAAFDPKVTAAPLTKLVPVRVTG